MSPDLSAQIKSVERAYLVYRSRLSGPARIQLEDSIARLQALADRETVDDRNHNPKQDS